jgi:hypothetical protein
MGVKRRLYWALDPDEQQEKARLAGDQTRDIADAKELRVTANTVIFENGELVGADVARFLI